MATRLCKLPALPSFGMRPGATNFTCYTCHSCQCLFSEAFRRTIRRQRFWEKRRDAGEPCGAIGYEKVPRRVVGFHDGAMEPPRSHRVAESRLLERVGGVQNSERGFHQGFFVGPHRSLLLDIDFGELGSIKELFFFWLHSVSHVL